MPVESAETAEGVDTTEATETTKAGKPLVTKDGEDTGLVLADDGKVYPSKSSGGYTKGSGSSGYSRSSGSSYRSGRSSSYRGKKKKKGSTSSSSTGGMWPGFPFNRPPSPIRQLVLDAIAASQAKGKSKK